MERVAVVHALTKSRLRRLEACGRFDRVAYASSAASDGELAKATRLKLTRLSFADAPKAYLDHWKMAYDWSLLALARPGLKERAGALAAALGLAEPHALHGLEKWSGFILAPDCKLVALGEALLPGARKTYFVKEPELLRLARPVDAEIEPEAVGLARALEEAKALGYAAYLAARILLPTPRGGSAERPTILFEQYYSTMVDYEFIALYRYFKTRDDVLYACREAGDEKDRYLASERKPRVVHRWSVRGWGAALRELGRALRLATAPGIPASLRLAALKLLKAKLHYESLFDAYKPKLFLRVRADMEPFHPVITAAARARGVVHVGYSCGSYPLFVHFYGLMDFDYYGVIGRHVRRDIYPTWGDGVRYPILGPVTVEMRGGPPPARSVNRPPVVGVFSTSSEREFFIQDAFYREFLEAGRDAAVRLGGRAIFKEKYLTDERLGWLRGICDGRVEYEISSLDPRSGITPKSVPEVIDESDIVLVMDGSTCSWEALARKKKVLVYEQPWITHPFERYEPRLVVKDKAAFDKALDWLWALPQEEYEALIEPLVESCGKFSNGSLAKDFIEGIEKEIGEKWRNSGTTLTKAS